MSPEQVDLWSAVCTCLGGVALVAAAVWPWLRVGSERNRKLVQSLFSSLGVLATLAALWLIGFAFMGAISLAGGLVLVVFMAAGVGLIEALRPAKTSEGTPATEAENGGATV